jgi:hypothetical protein
MTMDAAGMTPVLVRRLIAHWRSSPSTEQPAALRCVMERDRFGAIVSEKVVS